MKRMLSSSNDSQSDSGARGSNVKPATWEVYVQMLLESFDVSTGKVKPSRAAFCQVLLRMHAWFTTSVHLFRILTNNALHASLPITNETAHESKQTLSDINNNICCTCSDMELRRRNNRYLSRLVFDDPDLTASVPISDNHITPSTSSTPTNGEITSIVPHSTSLSLSSSHCHKICFVLSYWMQQFPLHFEPGTELYEAVEQFKQTLEKEQGLHELISGDIPSYDWMRRVTAKTAGIQRSDSQNKISLVFQNLSSEDLAKHLSYIDYKACRRITLSEYKSYAHSGTMAGCTLLERSVTIFNGLTQWVQLMVLSKTHPRQRAAIISKFVRVSQHLLNLKCYNTCMAVVGGISHSSIARLHKTYSYLNADTLKLLEDLTEVISAKNNYQNYRKCAAQVANSTYSLPIIGIHLKDLITIHTGLPDTVGTTEPPHINFYKMSQLSGVISCLTKLQDLVPEYSVNTDLIDTLKLALDVFYSEEEIFELSLAREPRANGGSTTNVPKDAPKPADQQSLLSEWQTGLKPPDKETINKHVSNMVTAIFKNYDLDRDGYISVEEFETISSNFPFIESSFCVLDVSDNGLLSEGEVKKYFILAKCSSLKRSFKHNFTETTYFKLTYCDHCSGLLWGLIKQGWKCKDCAINAHKSCKDRVVMDCKSKAMSNGGISKTSTSAVLSTSTSASSLSTSPSPQTPSTPEMVHNESRFTFSRLSTKSRSSAQTPAVPPYNNSCPSHSKGECTNGSLTPSVSQGHSPLANDLAADPELLTMKLLEYQHLLSTKDRELEAEVNEKRLLQERCTKHLNEIQSLKRQLAAIKQVTVSTILPQVEENELIYSPLTTISTE